MEKENYQMHGEASKDSLCWGKGRLTDGQVMGPQGKSVTGGGGLARVPNLHVCKHPWWPGGTRREGKGELTSCRGTVQSAWQGPPVSRTRRKSRAARKGKWPPRGTANRQAPPILGVRPSNRQGW